MAHGLSDEMKIIDFK